MAAQRGFSSLPLEPPRSSLASALVTTGPRAPASPVARPKANRPLAPRADCVAPSSGLARTRLGGLARVGRRGDAEEVGELGAAAKQALEGRGGEPIDLAVPGRDHPGEL